MIYNTIIIGRGLIGSATAKYISRSQKNVALIGPDEATTAKEKIVFASHYDQARIQGIVGKDAVTTMLNQQSANEYASLEKETGIIFHTKEGCLTVFPEHAIEYFDNFKQLAKKFDVKLSFFENGDSLKKCNAYFNFPSLSKGVYEHSPAGHINPRLLIQAQEKVFEKNAGEIFNKTVKEISREKELQKVTTFDGLTFYAKKIVVAAGAFSNFFNLLKEKVALKLKSESTIWVKVNENEARRLQSLPSLLYKINEPEVQDIYLVQPVKYPDGNFYLKIGANIPEDTYFTNLTEIQQWFKYKREINISPLRSALQLILPGLSVSDCFEKRCIVCYTLHGKPYIGPIEDKSLYIAAGGNGYAAMSSDALGKIAATVLMENDFPNGFFEKDFKPVFEKGF